MSVTIKNPLFWTDLPDVDVIRVKDTFYMISTSMHMMPGCPIMKSQDLQNWELVGYVFDTLEDNDAHNLVDGQNMYGQGSWAASLRYHRSTFYVCFSCNDTDQFYVYQSKDIENGPWSRSIIPGLYHDPALLFDNGRVFVVYGCGDIGLRELTADVQSLKPGGLDQMLLQTPSPQMRLRCEGCHAYKIGDYHYLFFIEWPADGHQRRRQVCYRAKELLGPYERKVVFDDDMGYHNHGIAQGAMFDDSHGEWYAMLFQDHDAVGRIPYLLPLVWEEGWPILGVNGGAPNQFEVDLPDSPAARSLTVSESFKSDRLGLRWQWNHNPDPNGWSLTDAPGQLRLYTGAITSTVLQARNTLTQRTEGPGCTVKTKLHNTHMKPGDYSGLIALQNSFGTIGVRASEKGIYRVEMAVNDGAGGEQVLESVVTAHEHLYLRIDFDFRDSVDTAVFSYSTDGSDWYDVGQPLEMKYTLDHFMGYRIGLFNYASQHPGGWVDFSYFQYDRHPD